MSSRLSHSVRNRLAALGWPPRSRLVRLACYALALDLLLFALQRGLRAATLRGGDSLGVWIGFLSIVAILLFTVVAFRWIRQRLSLITSDAADE